MKERILRYVHQGRIGYKRNEYFSYQLIKYKGNLVEIRPKQDFLEVYSLKGNLICTASRLITNTFGALA